MKKTTTWQKILTVWPEACGKKRRATVNWQIALIGHKRAGNFELAIHVQNSMRNYQLLKIIVFC